MYFTPIMLYNRTEPKNNRHCKNRSFYMIYPQHVHCLVQNGIWNYEDNLEFIITFSCLPHKYHHPRKTFYLTLKMTTAQAVETSVTNNSLSEDYLHPDDRRRETN